MTEEERLLAGQRLVHGGPAARAEQRSWNAGLEERRGPYRQPSSELAIPEGQQALTFEQMARLMATTVQAAVRESREDSITPGLLDDVSTQSSGARGASSYMREKKRFEEKPSDAFLDVQARTRRKIGSAPGSPTKFSSLLKEISFGSHATMKRMFLLLSVMAEAAEIQDHATVRGYIAQGMRWIQLAVEGNQKDP